MHVLVAGWIGSTNLGDELVFAGLRRLLRARGAQVTAVSRDPETTRSLHGVAATPADTPWRLLESVRSADAMVFGGGGLVQDETSPFNLPYHLARPAVADLGGVPWAGIGLGVGPVRTLAGRTLTRILRRATGLSVRDPASADLLTTLGVPGAAPAADLAFHLPRPEVEVQDRLIVCLRAWGGSGGGLLPVRGAAQVDATPAWFVDGAAAALDAAADATGLAVTFVALQADRDDAIHARVAARMHTPSTRHTPGLDDVVPLIASGRVVVAMRYHAAIASILGGRPVALLGYSPKVASLAEALGAGGRLLDWSPAGLARLPSAATAVAGNEAAVETAYERLAADASGNERVLDRLLAAAS